MRRVLVGFGVALCVASPAQAKMPVATLVKATQFIEAKKPREAYALLKASFDPKDTNPDELFILGLAAKQAGEVVESIGHFETTLAQAPDAHRVRLELAASWLELGESEKAKSLLLTVRAANPPTAVAQNIDRFLDVVSAAQPKTWRVWGSVGVLYDTNANAGPSVDTVTLFGLPFTLSSTAKPQADKALVVNLGLDHVKPITDTLAWQTAINLKGTDYARLHDLDNLYGYASTGLLWRQTPSLIWSLPVFVDGSSFRGGEAWYALSYGFNPQVRYTLNPLWEVSLGGTLALRDYQSDTRDNVLAWAVTPGLAYKIASTTLLRGSVSHGQEVTDQRTYANQSWSLNLGAAHSFSKELSLNAFVRLSDVQYEEMELAFDDIRHDRIWQVGGDITYRMQPIDWDLILSASYTDNQSNLDLYAYDRLQILLAARKAY